MFDARTLANTVTLITITLMALTLGSGCDGRLLAAGNVLFAVVPCVLLWVTVNLRKVG